MMAQLVDLLSLDDATSVDKLLGLLRASMPGPYSKIAGSLGVSTRTVERWYTTAQQKRRPGAQMRQKIVEKLSVKVVASGSALNSSGIGGRGATWRPRDFKFTLTPQQVREVRGYLRAGDQENAYYSLFDAYGFVPTFEHPPKYQFEVVK